MTIVAQESYPLLNVMWTMLALFCWILWIWLLITVYSDLFRRKDIGGGAKTLWVVFTLFLPFVGVLTYLIAQGRGMAERRIDEAQQQRRELDAYVRSVAASSHDGAEELSKANDLYKSGALTADEYEALKRKVLA